MRLGKVTQLEVAGLGLQSRSSKGETKAMSRCQSPKNKGEELGHQEMTVTRKDVDHRCGPSGW